MTLEYKLNYITKFIIKNIVIVFTYIYNYK